MTTDQWGRVRSLFQSALEQADEDRTAFLADACQGDEVIQREVESLIAAHAASGGFLETPAFRVSAGVETPALKPGERLGNLEVIGVLGRGGMGEVYRARDARLGREVALKVLPRALASDPHRLARFERESRILASLNHSHIGAIHNVEQFGAQRVLVLELVEGPTLGERLQAGPLPPAEALEIARQLAEALEAAHDRGIVHRDLKPANIKLTSSSGIKLLDFGVAKEHVREAVTPDQPMPDATVDGLLLGTCGYMSPEQARGKTIDKRTDIWAFGCVLYEMLCGVRAFRGDTSSDTIGAVLEREPDWSRLPASTSPGIRRLLRRCLEKDPSHRLHDVADARIEIEDALSNREDTVASGRPRAVGTLAASLALVAAVLVLSWSWRDGLMRREEPAGRMTRFTWALPGGLGLDSPPTVSPDGQLIAFTARADADSPSILYVRPLNNMQPRPIAGTQGAKQPFWSPDGRSLAYFARGRLMKVALEGGAPVEICAAPDGRGGTWGTSGVIVFSPLLIASGLMRVSQNGGKVEAATLLDVEQGENAHRWPSFLPDGVHFVYFVRAPDPERRGVYLGRIDRPASKPGTPLFRSESEAVYAPLDGGDRGVLLTVAGDRIEAHPFDPRRRVFTGDPRTIDLAAAGNTLYHAMMLSASGDVMAIVDTSVPFGARIVSTGRNGENPTLGDDRAARFWPRLSPDGTRLAHSRIDAPAGRTDLWIEDLSRGTRVRVPGDPSVMSPVWSPDSERLAYLQGSLVRAVVTVGAADGTGSVATVDCPGLRCDPNDWSPDGRWLLATVSGERDDDIWMLPADGRGPARPLFNQPYAEHDARFSPDGQLVAYVSEETGRSEVSVQTIDGRWRDVISVAGGSQPVWSRDGRELFFVDPQGRLRSAPLSMRIDGRPRFGASVLLKVPPIGSGHWGTQYDVSADGRRIYLLDRRVDPPPSEFGVVVGWQEMLK